MKTKLVALNLLLLIGVGAVVWQAKTRWDNAQLRRRAGLSAKVAPPGVAPLAPAPKPDAPAPAQYADVAQKNLFAKDRNPNVIIDAPPPQKPPAPMPPLPVMYGVMGLPSGMRALMAEKVGAASRPVHTGDSIGDFKILSLDAQNIVFEWDGKPVSRKVDDLMDRSYTGSSPAGQPSAPASAGGAPVAQSPPTPTQQQIQGKPPEGLQPASNVPPKLGVEMGPPGQSERACDPADASPAGTALDGYKKTIVYLPFGAQCRWVLAK
jgi:hypothetical protein